MGKIILLTIVTLSVQPALSQTKKAAATSPSDVESILDRLEKRLLDQEGQVLTFDEKKAFSRKGVKRKEKADRVLQFEEAKISTELPEVGRIQEIATLVQKLDEDVERLANEVQGAKQKVMENAKVDNFIEIEANLEDPDKTAIRTLSVTLDGYEVYSLDEAAGLWMPKTKIPLYAGPMQSGKHKLEVHARLIMRESQGLPINQSIYKVVKKSADILVPDGIVKRKWRVNLAPPTKVGKPAKATIQRKKQ